jgi:hypothetical protein
MTTTGVIVGETIDAVAVQYGVNLPAVADGAGGVACNVLPQPDIANPTSKIHKLNLQGIFITLIILNPTQYQGC